MAIAKYSLKKPKKQRFLSRESEVKTKKGLHLLSKAKKPHLSVCIFNNFDDFENNLFLSLPNKNKLIGGL